LRSSGSQCKGLPRVLCVPCGKDFDLFGQLAKAGQRLAKIHVHYEQQPEYKLTKVEKKGEKLDYRVTKTNLSKDKTTLFYNQFLTLSGIPKETYEYRISAKSFPQPLTVTSNLAPPQQLPR
jgi:predicted helicase